MPITKDGNGVIQYTEYKHRDRFEPTGVIPDSAFAVCDEQDVTKQLQLNASNLATNTTRTVNAPTQDGNLLAYTPPSGTVKSGRIVRYQDGAWSIGWKIEPSREQFLYEDWLTSLTPNGETGWVRTVSGTGATTTALSASAAGNAPSGVHRLSTGTTAAGRCALHRGVNNINIQAGNTQYGYVEMMGRVTTLDDGVDTFNLKLGLGDSTGAATWADGMYFYYDHSISSNWLCRTSASSVTTETDTGVPVSTNYVKFSATMDDTGIYFYINDALVAWHITNIPFNTNIGLAMQITKTAGTNARTYDTDYFLLRTWFSADRRTL